MARRRSGRAYIAPAAAPKTKIKTKTTSKTAATDEQQATDSIDKLVPPTRRNTTTNTNTTTITTPATRRRRASSWPQDTHREAPPPPPRSSVQGTTATATTTNTVPNDTHCSARSRLVLITMLVVIIVAQSLVISSRLWLSLPTMQQLHVGLSAHNLSFLYYPNPYLGLGFYDPNSALATECVDPSAIRRRYHQLMRLYHPDKQHHQYALHQAQAQFVSQLFNKMYEDILRYEDRGRPGWPKSIKRNTTWFESAGVLDLQPDDRWQFGEGARDCYLDLLMD